MKGRPEIHRRNCLFNLDISKGNCITRRSIGRSIAYNVSINAWIGDHGCAIDRRRCLDGEWRICGTQSIGSRVCIITTYQDTGFYICIRCNAPVHCNARKGVRACAVTEKEAGVACPGGVINTYSVFERATSHTYAGIANCTANSTPCQGISHINNRSRITIINAAIETGSQSSNSDFGFCSTSKISCIATTVHNVRPIFIITPDSSKI